MMQSKLSLLRAKLPLRRHALKVMLALLLAFSAITSAFAWLAPAPSVPTGMRDNIFHPAVAVDSANMVHVVWLRFPGSVKENDVFYVRGQLDGSGTGITWEGIQQLSGPRARDDRFPRIAVDNSGVVHVVWGGVSDDDKVYYRQNAARGAAGAWSPVEVAAAPNSGRNWFSIDLAIDAEGRPYVAWGQGLGDGDARAVVTRRNGPNSWAGAIEFSTRHNLVRNVRLQVAGAGDSATTHLVYEYKRSSADCSSCFNVGYTFGPFAPNPNIREFSRSFGIGTADNPALGLDPSGRLFAVFVTGSVSTDYSLRFTQSADGGATWSAPATLQLGASIWPEQPWVFACNNIAHVVSDQKRWTGNGFSDWLLYYINYNAATNQFSPFVKISNNEKSMDGMIAAGGPGKVAVWTINNTGEIKFNVDPGLGCASAPPTHTPTTEPPTTEPPTITPSPSPSPTVTPSPTPIPLPGAQPVIEAGADFTKNASLAVSFTNVANGPTEVRYRWDSVPTDADAWQPFSTNISVPAPSNLDPNACSPRTLYTQVRGPTGTQADVSQDIITFDLAVQARAVILSTTSQASPTNKQSQASAYPRAGRADWIRFPQYVYRVLPEPVGCAGVETYTAASNTSDGTHTGSETSNIWVTIDPSQFTSDNATGNGFAEAPITARVQITDKLGNASEQTQVLRFDDDQPKATTLGTLTVSNDNGSNAIAEFTLPATLVVTDDSYGAAIGQTTKAWWGAWVLVSNTAIADPSPEVFAGAGDASRSPAQVVPLQPGATKGKFSLITLDPNLTNPGSSGGQRHIYVRLLDGAGNFSNEVLSAQVTLNNLYTKPTLRLPIIKR